MSHQFSDLVRTIHYSYLDDEVGTKRCLGVFLFVIRCWYSLPCDDVSGDTLSIVEKWPTLRVSLSKPFDDIMLLIPGCRYGDVATEGKEIPQLPPLKRPVVGLAQNHLLRLRALTKSSCYKTDLNI